MEILATAFIGVICGWVCVWHSPRALNYIAAKCQGRKQALRVQKAAYLWFQTRLDED